MPDDVIIEDPGEDPGNWGDLGDWSDDGIEDTEPTVKEFVAG
jgi:hypothetical protein